MPTYDYQCRTCGHRFEYFQSITSDALTTCPVDLCIQEDPLLKGTGELVRLVSGGAGLVFKGEGFYLTDYARKKSSPSTGGSGSGGNSGGKDSGSSGGSSGGSSSGGSSGGGSSSGGSSSSGSDA